MDSRNRRRGLLSLRRDDHAFRGQRSLALAFDASPLLDVADVRQSAQHEIAIELVVKRRVDVAEIAAIIAELELARLVLHLFPLFRLEEVDDIPVELNALRDLVVARVQEVAVR